MKKNPTLRKTTLVLLFIAVTIIQVWAVSANIALNKTVTTSSDHLSGSYPGSEAVDGDTITDTQRWVSGAVPASVTSPQWIEINLGVSYNISTLKLWTGFMGYNTPITDFQFQYWTGTLWQDIFSETGNTNSKYSKSFTEVIASKVRLFITKNDATNPENPPVRLFEIQVWGELPPHTAVTYFVSPTGDNTNNGSDIAPFKTIQKAAEVMLAGDVCRIHAGTYRETVIPAGSGTVGSPIIFEAYGDGDVIVDGADVLSGWVQHSGNIYRASMNWDLTVQNQVFVNDAMAHLARWPNVVNVNDPFFDLNNYATPDRAGSSKDIIVDSDLPDKPTDFWKDAVLWADFGYKWSSFGTKITSSSGKTLNYSGGDTQHRPGYPAGTFLPTDKDLYYLAGKLELLDADNEWYYDPINKYLYIQVPGGGNPGSTVKAKKRQFAFDLNNLSYITVKGLKVFGSNIRMQNSLYCMLDDINARYISHHSGDGVAAYTGGSAFGAGGLGITMSGSNNTVKNCTIKYSAGSGVLINGNNHTLDNNDIQYTNYLANYTEAVKISTGSNNRVTRNKIWYTASTLISCDRGLTASNDDNALILYNDLGYGDRLIDDRGGVNGNGYEVAYNWIHDLGVGLAVGSCGALYSDNATDFATYHHNVVWNQMNDHLARINNTSDGNDGIFIYNNTGYNIEKTNPVTREDITISAKNNFVDQPANNFVNAAAYDFRLATASAAINQGEHVAGITNGYSDSKPDLGAYEYGGSDAVSNWKAGLGVIMYYNGEGGPVTGVSILPSQVVLAVGGKRQLGFYTTPINATNENVSWTSSNPEVATVSTTGLVTAKGPGESIITVNTLDGGFTATNNIKVGIQNVALTKSATASSVYSDGFLPNSVTDGQISTLGSKWMPIAGSGSPQWVELNLAGNFTIGGIKFYSGSGLSGGSDVLISDFQFQIWNGSAWQSVVTESGNKDQIYAKAFPDVNTTKVRMLITNDVPTGSLLRLYELEVYGVTAIPFGVTSFLINDDNAFSSDSTIIVNNVVDGGTPTMYVIGENETLGTNWLSYAANFKYVMQNKSEGSRTIYFKVKDSNGQETPVVSKNIYYKTPHAKGNPSAPQAIISPNPVIDVARIKMVENDGINIVQAPENEYWISFYTITNQLLKESKEFGTNFSFNLSDLPSGFILVKIRSKDSTSTSTKIILKR